MQRSETKARDEFADRSETNDKDDMTARAQCTQAEIQRRIRAAKAEGLRVRGIRPDGTVLVDGPGLELEQDARLAPETSKWLEVKA